MLSLFTVFHHWYTLTQFMTWKCISPKSSRSFLIKYSLSWFFQNKLFINIIFITYYLHIIISHNLCCSLYRKLLLYHYWRLSYTHVNDQELSPQLYSSFRVLTCCSLYRFSGPQKIKTLIVVVRDRRGSVVPMMPILGYMHICIIKAILIY